jgi:hypothetical protein
VIAWTQIAWKFVRCRVAPLAPTNTRLTLTALASPRHRHAGRDGARGEDLPSPRQSCVGDLAWMRAVRPRRTHCYEACRAVNVYVHGVRCYLLGRADSTVTDRPRWVFTGYRLPTSRGLGPIALLCVPEWLAKGCFRCCSQLL